jgi:hypothetical protein
MRRRRSLIKEKQNTKIKKKNVNLTSAGIFFAKERELFLD